jgi:hypothetical protein
VGRTFEDVRLGEVGCGTLEGRRRFFGLEGAPVLGGGPVGVSPDLFDWERVPTMTFLRNYRISSKIKYYCYYKNGGGTWPKALLRGLSCIHGLFTRILRCAELALTRFKPRSRYKEELILVT